MTTTHSNSTSYPVQQQVCTHPPKDYYAWFAYNCLTDCNDWLCIGCKLCGQIIHGSDAEFQTYLDTQAEFITIYNSYDQIVDGRRVIETVERTFSAWQAEFNVGPDEGFYYTD